MLNKSIAAATAQLRALAASSAASTLLPAVAVLGNEGGDYDSVVGALYTAWACNQRFMDVAAVPRGTPFVPFLNFPTEDLPLRGDILHSLQRAQVDTSALLSAVEGDGAALLAACRWVVLFDHNKVTAAQAALQERVVAIVDHHADEGLNTDVVPRVVRVAGSACSLLTTASLLTVSVDDIPEKDLLLGAILLDTANFSDAMKKTTPADLTAAAFLAGMPPTLDAALLAAAMKDRYDVLSAWKADVSHLTIPQSLRRDYKAFTMPLGSAANASPSLRIGVASWVESCGVVLRRWTGPTLLSALREHCDANGLDAVIVMFASGADDTFRREALWSARTEAAAAVLDAYFADRESAAAFDAAPELSAVLFGGAVAATDLSATVAASHPGVGVVHQRNAAASRKQLVPWLTNFIAAAKL